MKIDEVIRGLKVIRREYGNLVVRYDDNDTYPSEVCYIEYREISPRSALAKESDRLRNYVKLI